MEDLVQIEENLIEEESVFNQFHFEELADITDFTNLREGDFTGRFLILSKGQNLPNNLEGSIQNAGGEIVKTFPQIGVAVAVARTPDFLSNAKKINGVESVTPDLILQYTKEPETRGEDIQLDLSTARRGSSSSAGTPFNYQDAFLDGFQWAPSSIDAPAAWDNGFTGNGVRVAVIDGGFFATHVDLAPNMDIQSSRSTVPGVNFNQDLGGFWHGTHVAGIVAAAGNGIVGIAPEATIIGVKALHGGSGAFEWILEAILYSATPQAAGGAGADIINMSLGATIPYRDSWSDKEFRDAFRDLQKTYDRATRFAYQNGVTVIAAAGNGGNNFDDAKELFQLPAQNQHVLSISSTGPTGWLLGNDNFSQPAYYTDHGKSLVDFAAPGGTLGLWVVEGFDGNCTLNGTNLSFTSFCEVFDQVISCNVNNGWAWAQGTSMAAPAAAGVAALILQANNGKLSPAQVAARMRQSATDLGKPGQDEFYGHGFVNAAKAVGLN
ncbi:serine alkaline protease (subtilisin E) [Indibacter alkaliphilus LW1]|uniref:Serine alkaline protease (Subtilisin E) n=1 Tax=Indibacter alkaliphilus (strain CCUG 57479 / KCTC 22604 / LW1) TaxID=1189612 RepID=S2EDV2_INDAL|nr:S8 family serine peptidase [Indibacter alkaliphilus]EPA00529.1 serine alkaline protease (subtilisin E) [Indibacter alkaliphilus LW1]